MDFQIMMDGGGDLSEELRYNSHVTVVPMKIRIGEEDLTADEHLKRSELLNKIRGTTQIPKTACPSPAAFVELCDKEAERIYIITISDALSGSHNSAVLAETILNGEYSEKKICVVNSKCASAGQTLLVLRILEWEEQGISFNRICCRINQCVKKLNLRAAIRSLEMLERSGRLTGLRAKAANVFHICPLVAVTDEGTLEQSAQARGDKKALQLLIRQIEKDIRQKMGQKKPEWMVISYCGCPESAFMIKAVMSEKYPEMKIAVAPTMGIATMFAGENGIITAY